MSEKEIEKKKWKIILEYVWEATYVKEILNQLKDNKMDDFCRITIELFDKKIR